MKTMLALMGVASVLAIAQPAAADAPWTSINQRQVQIDQRIDAGIRDGSLSRPEAARLRGEFANLARLEDSYRRDGLSPNERADLNARFDRLSAQVYVERHDQQGGPGMRPPPGPGGGWVSINQRQAQLDARIDAGVRDRSLSMREATRLRREFNQIARLETQYRRSGGGLTMNERRDLDARFDRLSMQIRGERHDWDNRRY